MGIEHYGFAFFIFILACLLMILYNYLFSDMKRQKKLLDEKENKLLRLYQSVEEALDDFHDSVERSHGEISGQLKELGELHAEVERSMRGLAAHAPARIERHESPMAARRPAVPQAAAPTQIPPRMAQAPQPTVTRPMAQAIPQQPAMTRAAPIPQPEPQAEPAGQSLADSIGQAAANIRAAAPVAAQAAQAPAPQAEPVAAAPQTMAPPPVFRHVMEAVEQMEQMDPPAAPPALGRNEQILALSQEGKTRSQIAKELGITLSEVDLVIGMNK